MELIFLLCEKKGSIRTLERNNLSYAEQHRIIIKGTSSVVEDTKNLYLDLFEDAKIKYNEKHKKLMF